MDEEFRASLRPVAPVLLATYPKILQIDLDQRVSNRKRIEMEPLSDPKIVNLSISAVSEGLFKENVPLRVPKRAAWFSYELIHPIEDKYFSAYTQSYEIDKTPESYKQIRNTIIGLYRQQPQTYLAVTECVEHLDGSLVDILKIHTFLEHFGLINFQVR